ncbi:hypothetical protein [Streptomyces flavidovirens]|uniref:hypothetical protein n=1 Tax=Streptomyces flavidovirens TaxID=67298 RepID=UPI00055ECD43|nr:hypothetical protein [Streptomyces flavidovirens]
MTTRAAKATTRPVRSRCRYKKIPPAQKLSYDAYAGRACYACGRTLTTGAILVGRATGRQGVHVLDVDVYACP